MMHVKMMYRSVELVKEGVSPLFVEDFFFGMGAIRYYVWCHCHQRRRCVVLNFIYRTSIRTVQVLKSTGVP